MKGASKGPYLANVNGAEISLTDNGKGIPENISKKLFEPFFTTKESSIGSGFGLYNSKLFIEDHNGKIDFSSMPGQGSTFYLFLPLVEDDGLVRNKKRVRRATKEFVKARKKTAQ